MKKKSFKQRFKHFMIPTVFKSPENPCWKCKEEMSQQLVNGEYVWICKNGHTQEI